MEKVLWLIKLVKSGLPSFVLEISHWTMLHGWVDQLKLIAIQSETLIENNQCYTTWEVADIFKNIQINKVIGENEKCVF